MLISPEFSQIYLSLLCIFMYKMVKYSSNFENVQPKEKIQKFLWNEIPYHVHQF